MDHEVALEKTRACSNCTTELSGKFCHKCGQKELHHDAWSLSHFLHDAWHEIAHLDSKIFRTLKLLVLRPGEMTRMYLDGHRQPFVNPVRLYLALTALFFFFGGQTDFSVEGFQRSGNAGGLTQFVEAVAKKKGVPYEVELKEFNQGFHKKFSIFIAMGVLMYGLTVHWAYRKREIWYSRSLIFAVHFFCLFFLWLLVWRLGLHYLANAGIRVPMQLFFVLSLLLLAISLRHVWPESPGRFVPKVLFLWFSSIVVYTVAVGLAIGLQIALYGRMAQLAYRK
jgi:hypothetical protein